jgi:predicted acetyltransferase
LPGLAYADSYVEARREGYRDGSGDTAGPEIASDRLAAHITRLNDQGGTMRFPSGEEAPKAPFAHLWMVAGGELIGRVGVRYALNPLPRRWGGQVGYEIRPAHRRQGFGHRTLALGVAHARSYGVRNLLLTCDDDNAASARIIERGGGVLEDRVVVAPGRLARRYWIRLDIPTSPSVNAPALPR